MNLLQSGKCKNNGYKEGAKHLNWKGGFYFDAAGYKRVLIAKRTYRLEHVLVMERHLGRSMQPGEVVHHINGIKDDNRLENLKFMAHKDHNSLHQAGRVVSEKTKAKLRVLRAGTHQKEEHNQWREDVTKEKIIKAIEESMTFAEAAKLLDINVDTLRARRQHYHLI